MNINMKLVNNEIQSIICNNAQKSQQTRNCDDWVLNIILKKGQGYLAEVYNGDDDNHMPLTIPQTVSFKSANSAYCAQTFNESYSLLLKQSTVFFRWCPPNLLKGAQNWSRMIGGEVSWCLATFLIKEKLLLKIKNNAFKEDLTFVARINSEGTWRFTQSQ